MPRIYLVQATLKRKSGLPEDFIVNDFVVQADETWDPDSQLIEVTGTVASFYNLVQSTTKSIASYLGPSFLNTANAHELNVYDITDNLDGSPHGSPVATDTFSTAAVSIGFDPMADEVASVLTLRGQGWQTALVETADADVPADAKRDRPRQRHTGRIFLGPLNTTANETDPALYVSRPLGTFRTTVLDSLEDLQDGLLVNGHRLCVWSRKNAAVYEVVAGEVDNAWDTVRSRGVDPTIRQQRIVVP